MYLLCYVMLEEEEGFNASLHDLHVPSTTTNDNLTTCQCELSVSTQGTGKGPPSKYTKKYGPTGVLADSCNAKLSDGSTRMPTG